MITPASVAPPRLAQAIHGLNQPMKCHGERRYQGDRTIKRIVSEAAGPHASQRGS